jgi:hypothetical protein
MFKPLPYLHACTTNLPNMEGFVSKTTNSLPELPTKSHVELKDNSIETRMVNKL